MAGNLVNQFWWRIIDSGVTCTVYQYLLIVHNDLTNPLLQLLMPRSKVGWMGGCSANARSGPGYEYLGLRPPSAYARTLSLLSYYQLLLKREHPMTCMQVISNYVSVQMTISYPAK